MFGPSKPVVIDRYGSRRTRRSVPRWLVLLLLGIAIGAGGVVVVQERYLPPRLSAAESVALRRSFEQADSERLRLRAELAAALQRRDAALADQQRLGAELAASRATGQELRDVAASLVEALPPDPRGGDVEVRAARFDLGAGGLAYDIVLTRPRSPAKPLSAVLQLVVTGTATRGASTVTLAPIPISVAAYESVRGRVPLPDGLKPREAVVNVLDRPGGRLLGKRVLYVK
jgi:hypothetical protein